MAFSLRSILSRGRTAPTQIAAPGREEAAERLAEMLPAPEPATEARSSGPSSDHTLYDEYLAFAAILSGERRSSLADPDPFLQWWFTGGGASAAGILVNEQTALSCSRVYQAVRVISDAVSTLPLPVYRRIKPRGRQRELGHPVYLLLDEESSPGMSAATFRATLMGHVLLWGNGYAWIQRDAAGRPYCLRILRPDRVWPERDPENWNLVYKVYQPGNACPTTLEHDEVFHIRGLGFDGLVGYSIIRMARQGIALALAAETFGAAFFGNGTKPSGLLTHPAKLSDTAYNRLRESWNEKHRGPYNAQNPAILEEGLKWEPLSIPPDDAQFLQTREFQVTEIASWFNLAPHKLGDLRRATNNNIEQQSIDFVVHTIRPWLVTWESEIALKLFTPKEREDLYAEHLVDGLLRGDITTRYNAYAKAIQYGWACVDEVRAMENMNPLPNGQGGIYMVPVNMMPASVMAAQGAAASQITPDRIKQLIDEEMATQGAADNPAAAEDDLTLQSRSAAAQLVGDAPSRDQAMAALRPVLADAIRRILRRETEMLGAALNKPATFRAFYGSFEDGQRRYAGQALAPAADSIDRVTRLFGAEPPFTAASLAEQLLGQTRSLVTAVNGAPADELGRRVQAHLASWESRVDIIVNEILARTEPIAE